VNLDKDKAQTAWKKEHKKKKGDEPSHPIAEIVDVAYAKAKKKELKKTEEIKAPQCVAMATKAALNNAR
jgi:hypothetical protein